MSLTVLSHVNSLTLIINITAAVTQALRPVARPPTRYFRVDLTLPGGRSSLTQWKQSVPSPVPSLLVDRQDSSPECGCPSRPTWRHGISICPHAFAHAASHTPHIRDRPPKMAQLIPAYEIDRAQHYCSRGNPCYSPWRPREAWCGHAQITVRWRRKQADDCDHGGEHV